MHLISSNALKQKKAIMVTIKQVKNNLFASVSLSSFLTPRLKENLLLRYKRKLLRKFDKNRAKRIKFKLQKELHGKFSVRLRNNRRVTKARQLIFSELLAKEKKINKKLRARFNPNRNKTRKANFLQKKALNNRNIKFNLNRFKLTGVTSTVPKIKSNKKKTKINLRKFYKQIQKTLKFKSKKKMGKTFRTSARAARNFFYYRPRKYSVFLRKPYPYQSYKLRGNSKKNREIRKLLKQNNARSRFKQTSLLFRKFFEPIIKQNNNAYQKLTRKNKKTLSSLSRLSKARAKILKKLKKKLKINKIRYKNQKLLKSFFFKVKKSVKSNKRINKSKIQLNSIAEEPKPSKRQKKQ